MRGLVFIVSAVIVSPAPAWPQAAKPRLYLSASENSGAQGAPAWRTLSAAIAIPISDESRAALYVEQLNRDGAQELYGEARWHRSFGAVETTFALGAAPNAVFKPRGFLRADAAKAFANGMQIQSALEHRSYANLGLERLELNVSYHRAERLGFGVSTSLAQARGQMLQPSIGMRLEGPLAAHMAWRLRSDAFYEVEAARALRVRALSAEWTLTPNDRWRVGAALTHEQRARGARVETTLSAARGI